MVQRGYTERNMIASAALNRILSHRVLQPVRAIGGKLLALTNIRVGTRLYTGQWLAVNLSGDVGRSIWLRGRYGAPIEVHLRSTLRPGDIFVDIGANIGYFSIIASELVGAGGKIYAFEPNQDAFALLKKSIKMNQITNIECMPFAAGAKSGVVQFNHTRNISRSFLDATTPSQRENSQDKQAVRAKYAVQVVRLDDYIKIEESKRVRMVKIDAEGFDYYVLQGAVRLLSGRKPDVIIEVQDQTLNKYGHNPEDIFDLLYPLGYKAYECGSSQQIGVEYCKVQNQGARDIIFMAPG
jgi:FkbM family methyltransferase